MPALQSDGIGSLFAADPIAPADDVLVEGAARLGSANAPMSVEIVSSARLREGR